MVRGSRLTVIERAFTLTAKAAFWLYCCSDGRALSPPPLAELRPRPSRIRSRIANISVRVKYGLATCKSRRKFFGDFWGVWRHGVQPGRRQRAKIVNDHRPVQHDARRVACMLGKGTKHVGSTKHACWAEGVVHFAADGVEGPDND